MGHEPATPPPTNPPAPPAQPATLHLYQNRVYGFLLPKCRVYADGKLLCKLSRNSRCQLTLPAGTTTFTAKVPVFSFGTDPLTLQLEPGHTYYLEGGISPDGPIPGAARGLTQVVANPSKLAQLEQAKVVQPLGQ